MSILVYTENWDGKFKKLSYELVSYAATLANQLETSVTAISIGNVSEDELTSLGNYGANKVLNLNDEKYNSLDNKALSTAIGTAAIEEGAKVVLFAHTNLGKAIAPRVAVKLNAGLVSGVNALPVSYNPFVVKKKVFTGKAFAKVKFDTDVKVMTFAQNSYKVVETESNVVIESFNPAVNEGIFTTTVKETNKITGKVLLTDAEVVVAGGRGMKSGDNWTGLEEMADLLGAGLACSRPVSDEGWRPHAEHVGQTGKIIAPNLYLAFGISGAIQHLGGVSSSKVIVAVNKDAEAPIFETADYGIIGDVNKVIPQLIEGIKQMKA
ncbi:MAG: electron transfer flavoprotein subunit alpha/FixB family protein [Bacteroidetes bacterium]|nr:electron transfer flavoprotein subunit alpha/FixB family protein [Bacteroidota bacterium]MBL6943288.1 electron transfer flavoprotein subunit alpha/FixB family protein [Bacteroidales bacterium]